jgi:ketosteroid isomerase-like protein
MTDAHLRRVTQDLYELCSRGEWAKVETLLTDDFVAIESPQLPFGGVYRGVAGFRELFGRVFGLLDITSIEVEDITVGGNHAVAVLNMMLAGDPPVRVPLTEVFRFREGKVCEVRPHYFNPRQIIEAAEARKARAS